MIYFYTIDYGDYSIKRIKALEVNNVDNIYLTYDDAMKAIIELINYNKYVADNTRNPTLKKIFLDEIKKLKGVK